MPPMDWDALTAQAEAEVAEPQATGTDWAAMTAQAEAEVSTLKPAITPQAYGGAGTRTGPRILPPEPELGVLDIAGRTLAGAPGELGRAILGSTSRLGDVAMAPLRTLGTAGRAVGQVGSNLVREQFAPATIAQSIAANEARQPDNTFFRPQTETGRAMQPVSDLVVGALPAVGAAGVLPSALPAFLRTAFGFGGLAYAETGDPVAAIKNAALAGGIHLGVQGASVLAAKAAQALGRNPLLFTNIGRWLKGEEPLRPGVHDAQMVNTPWGEMTVVQLKTRLKASAKDFGAYNAWQSGEQTAVSTPAEPTGKAPIAALPEPGAPVAAKPAPLVPRATPVERVASPLLTDMEPRGAAVAPGATLRNLGERAAQEQAIIESAIGLASSDAAPAPIVKEFFEQTYPVLDPKMQQMVQAHIKGHTGFAPGETLSVGPDGAKTPIQSWQHAIESVLDGTAGDMWDAGDKNHVKLLAFLDELNKARAASGGKPEFAGTTVDMPGMEKPAMPEPPESRQTVAQSVAQADVPRETPPSQGKEPAVPPVVYHGTPEDFVKFEPAYEANARLYKEQGITDPTLLASNEELRKLGPLYFFSENEDVARGYADAQGEGVVKAVSLKATRTYDAPDREAAIEAVRSGKYDAARFDDTDVMGAPSGKAWVVRDASIIAQEAPTAPSATRATPEAAEAQPSAEVPAESLLERPGGTGDVAGGAKGGGTISDFLAGRRSGTVATLTDARTPEDRISLVLTPDTSNVGTYSIVAKTDRGSQTFRMQYRGGEPLSDVLAHFADYLNTDLTSKEFSVTPVEQKVPKPVVPLTADQIDKARIKELKAVRFKTAGQEKSIELLEARLKADPSKWAVGDGVGHKVAGQITRGYRIVDIDPATKEATISIVADTGLADAGIGDSQRVHIADLVRDNHFNAPESQGVPRGEVPPAEQGRGNDVSFTRPDSVPGSASPARGGGVGPKAGDVPAWREDVARSPEEARREAARAAGMSIVPTPRPEIQERMDDARGIKKPTIGEKFKLIGQTAWHKITRSHEFLSPTRANDSAREGFRQLSNVGAPQVDEVERIVASYLAPLDKAEYALLQDFAIIMDQWEGGIRGDLLSYGWSHADLVSGELQDYAKKLWDEVVASPKVLQAVKDRYEAGIKVRDAAQAAEVLGKPMLFAGADRDWYFHHMIPEEGGTQGTLKGTHRARPTGQAWQKGRAQSENARSAEIDHNSDLKQSDTHWLTSAMTETKKAELLNEFIKVPYHDVLQPQMEAEAAAWNTAHPAGPRRDTLDMVDDHPELATWQLREGGTFFKAWSIPDQLVQDMIASGGIEVKIPQGMVRKIIAVGGPKPSFILPKEVVRQLEKLEEPPKKEGPIVGVWHGGMKALKALYTAMGPHAGSYHIRNETGDVEMNIIGSPVQVVHWANRLKEAWDFYYTDKPVTPFMRAARDMGVMDASFAATELVNANDLPVFGQLAKWMKIGRLPTNLMEALRRFGKFRESLSRLAAFSYARAEIAAGRFPLIPATKPETLRILAKEHGVDYAAARYSRDLIGDYGDATVFGQWLSENVIPFWKFQEINMKRIPRISINGVRSREFKRLGKRGLYGAARAILLSRLLWLYTALHMWNTRVHKKQEDELSPRERSQPHIIIGERPDGTTNVFRRVGSTGEFLEWFGIPTAIALWDKYQAGQLTIGDLVAEAAAADLNKIVGMVRPDFKAMAEIPAGRSTFPDAINWRKKDRAEIAADILGMGDLWKEISGRIMQSGERARPGMGMRLISGISDPKGNALSEIYDLRERYMAQKGQEIPGDFGNTKTPFTIMRRAAQDGNETAFNEALRNYLLSGKSGDDFDKGLGRLDPIATKMNDEDEALFVNSFLTPQQRDQLAMARDFSFRIRDAMILFWRNAVERGDVAKWAIEGQDRHIEAIRKIQERGEAPAPATDWDAMTKQAESEVAPRGLYPAPPAYLPRR